VIYCLSIFCDTIINEVVVVKGVKEKAYKAGGSKMKQTNTLGNGTRIPHFFFMGEPERKKVVEWFNEIKTKVGAEKKKQRKFLTRIKRAMKVINYDYYIAILEPSVDKDGNIFYEGGNVVARGISLGMWERIARNFYFDGEWYSDLAMLEEGDLFKAYRIAMGYWTIEYVCDDSSSAGNYWNAPKSVHDFEVSGVREVGGFRDGIGNTCEIYHTKSGFALVGGFWGKVGSSYPVADVDDHYGARSICNHGSGVLVLKRSILY